MIISPIDYWLLTIAQTAAHSDVDHFHGFPCSESEWVSNKMCDFGQLVVDVIWL